MFERKSLKWPIALAVTMIVLLVSLMIGWVLLNIFGWQRGELSTSLYWILISAGSAMFTCVVVGVVLYLILAIQQINLNRRQSNFIDAVTHELKSPIASLKLYLQTLNRRPIEEPQRQDFYKAMLQDVERLDKVITQLLDVARLSHRAEESSIDTSPVRVDELVQRIVEEVQTRYAAAESDSNEPQPIPVISLDLEPVIIQGMTVDLDMLFRNLIDNAFKYGGKPCKIDISVHFDSKTNRLSATISDNGNGIPRSMRRRIFNRFFRIGDELERTKPGIGLGLFLVRNVIRRLKGSIAIVDIPGHSGTRFEISLPNASKVTSDENA
jgi:two-component system, OmpR family, phosphate regulon sensor histidine kinase PhoR